MMGVTGCGKSTIGAMLADRLSARFLDGDDFHPPKNVAKMSAGTPLTDEDRWPWLDKLCLAVEDAVSGAGCVVLACSALRKVYRDHLTAGCVAPPLFLHLTGPKSLIHRRVSARQDHYMPPALLDSQLNTLEPVSEGENALEVSIEPGVDEIVDDILGRFRATR